MTGKNPLKVVSTVQKIAKQTSVHLASTHL